MVLPITAFSQFEKLVNTFNDAIGTVTEKKMTLLFIDAQNAKPVSEAAIDINEIGEFTTNLAGRIVIDPQYDDTYTLKFDKVGYIQSSYTFEVVGGSIPNNKIAVSSEMMPEAIRIVLVWGKEPADLDAHFVKENGFHISSKVAPDPREKSAKLDRSDNTSYGPETITIANPDSLSIYTYYVKNYSGKDALKSLALSKSGAMVQVYKNNLLEKTYTVPPEQKGTVWTVFTIKNGKILDLNEIGN